MLALIDGQYFEMIPVPAPVGDIVVRLNPKTRALESYVGAHRIHFGPKYMKMTQNVEIDPKTGVFRVEKSGNVRFRVIFNGFHQDFEQLMTP